MVFRSSSRIPVWLLHAFACLAWWGLWGFLAKVGSDAASSLQLQVLFSLGMLPVALFALVKLRFRLTTKWIGATYGILNGLLTGLGLLAYYVAMRLGKASIVGPVTALFPLITIALAFVVLREKLNRIQGVGIVLAIGAVVLLSV
jgi:bacterial/archaeal transporter family protein